MGRVRGVLFDLDGVLIDSLESIGACFNHALAMLGRPVQPLMALRSRIGPPLEESAAELLESDDTAEVARFVALYRERYAVDGVAGARAVEGLREVLGALAAVWPLAVATSKAELYAQEILVRLGVAGQLRAICGRSLALDGEGKAAVIGRAVAAVFEGRAEGLVMVGDRRHDVVGARAHGIPTIGVLHGMGSREELAEAGARWIVDDLRGLPELLRAIDGGGVIEGVWGQVANDRVI